MRHFWPGLISRNNKPARGIYFSRVDRAKSIRVAFEKLLEYLKTLVNSYNICKCAAALYASQFKYDNTFSPVGKHQLSGRCAKRSCRFLAPSSRKIVYGPWPLKKKASDHMFINLGFASADNYMSYLKHFLFYWPCGVICYLSIARMCRGYFRSLA